MWKPAGLFQIGGSKADGPGGILWLPQRVFNDLSDRGRIEVFFIQKCDRTGG